jgi:hypothetical protein
MEMRRDLIPTQQHTALALESRLPRDSGALAAALRMTEQHAFFAPVLAGAGNDLREAERAKAPVLIRTRKLLLVPLAALASGVALAAAVGIDAPGAASPTIVTPESRPWTAVDVGGGRSEADREAYRKAQGLREAAATLNESAATLREAAAGAEARAGALRDAKAALARSGSDSAAGTASELPEKAPEDDRSREKLAALLEAAAKGLGSRAAAFEKGGARGSEDFGGTGTFDATGKAAEFIAMPAWNTTGVAPARAIASQTPARRELASRAVRELESLQD